MQHSIKVVQLPRISTVRGKSKYWKNLLIRKNSLVITTDCPICYFLGIFENCVRSTRHILPHPHSEIVPPTYPKTTFPLNSDSVKTVCFRNAIIFSLIFSTMSSRCHRDVIKLQSINKVEAQLMIQFLHKCSKRLLKRA